MLLVLTAPCLLHDFGRNRDKAKSEGTMENKAMAKSNNFFWQGIRQGLHGLTRRSKRNLAPREAIPTFLSGARDAKAKPPLAGHRRTVPTGSTHQKTCIKKCQDLI